MIPKTSKEPAVITMDWMENREYDHIPKDTRPPVKADDNTLHAANDSREPRVWTWNLAKTHLHEIERFTGMFSGYKTLYHMYVCLVNSETERRWNDESPDYQFPFSHLFANADRMTIDGEPYEGQMFAVYAEYQELENAVKDYNNVVWADNHYPERKIK